MILQSEHHEVKSVFAFGIHASHKTNQFPVYVDFIISRGEDYERPSSEGKLIMPTEDFEKAQKVNSDTQLYKQAGNSIVVNVLEEIFKEMF